jgi:orotidine-5'-phosphate decarboxylase
VLVRTSNPGSDLLQGLESRGRALFEHLALALREAEARLRGPRTGWSSLGAVVGATYPEDTARVRDLLPHALLLSVGYGAQRASAKEAVRGFVRGPAGLEGGIVNASRSVLFPPAPGSTAASFESALRASLHAAIDELTQAVR